MNRNVGIAVGIGIVIIASVIGFQFYDSTYKKSTSEDYYENPQGVSSVVYPENPQYLYGLKINKDKYLLGERIFMNIGEIPMGLEDVLIFYTPSGQAYLPIPIDGDKKSSFKHYFRPMLSLKHGICDKEQLIGEWTVAFQGSPENKLKFNVMEEILPHSEEYYVDCNREGMQMPQIDPSLGND